MRTTQFLITVTHADDADVDELESALLAQVEEFDDGLPTDPSRRFGFERHHENVFGAEAGI